MPLDWVSPVPIIFDPARWSYSFDTGGNSVAFYPGTVNIPVVQTGAATVQAATALNLSGVQQIVINRWTTTSLYAPATYQRVAGDPGTGAAFQDANGNWFSNIEPILTGEMFGAMGRAISYAGPDYDNVGYQIAVNVQRPIRAIQPSYRFGLPVQPVRGGMLWIDNGLNNGVTPTFSGVNATGGFLFTDDEYVSLWHFDGIGFNGERVRGTFPYAGGAGAYGFLAVADLHGDIANDDSLCEIKNCVFTDTHIYSWHATFFAKGIARGNRYIRTADHGFIACREVWFEDEFTEFSSDNGISVSRGCLRVNGSNNIYKDCEASGLWLAGFNNAGSGNLTITGIYTVLGQVTLVTDTGQFGQELRDTFITPIGASADSCIIKVISVESSTSLTGSVIIAVPADLQNTVTANWQYAPSLGVSQGSVTNTIMIGCYSSAIALTTAPKSISIVGGIIMRTGYIADSQVSATASIITGTRSVQLALNDGAKFHVNDFFIIDDKTSYQNYYISKITAIAVDVLTLDPSLPAAPQTYALQPARLCHRQSATFGTPINVTGNAVGQHTYAEDIEISGFIIKDFGGTGIRLGNSANGSARNIKIHHCSFTQPGGLGQATDVVLLQEATVGGVDYPTQYIRITDIDTDIATEFMRFSQKGPTARPGCVLFPNNAPNASTYFTALDANNSNFDVSQNYSWNVPAKVQFQPTAAAGTTVTAGGVFQGTMYVLQTGAVTINGVYTVGGAVTVTSAGLFVKGNIGSFIMAIGASVDNCIIALTGFSNTSTMAGVVITAVPADLQNIATTTWRLAAPYVPRAGCKFRMSIMGTAVQATIGNGLRVHMRYYALSVAHPAPPLNGDAVLGTVFTANPLYTDSTVAGRQMFNVEGLIGLTGDLVIGGPFAADAVVTSVGGTAASITDMQINLVEIPIEGA